MPNIKIGVYGTLRLGGSLHPYYLKDSTYLKTVSLPGYVMCTFRPNGIKGSIVTFPIVFQTNNKEDKITVDIFDTTLETYYTIVAIEPLQYYRTSIRNIDGTDCYMWIGRWSEELEDLFDVKIPNGDWLEYAQKYN